MTYTTDFTNADTADGLRLLRRFGLPHVRESFVRTYGVDRGPQFLDHISMLLEQAERLCHAEVEFQLYTDGQRLQCRVNGVHIPFDGVGLALAWLVLAGVQLRHPPLRPEWVFPGTRWRASTKQALDRARRAVERTSPNLASAIASLGIEAGLLAQKSNPQVRVRCTLDEGVAKLFSTAQ